MSAQNGDTLQFTDEEIDLLVWGIATAHGDLKDEAKRKVDPEGCDRLMEKYRRLLPKLQVLREKYVASAGGVGWNARSSCSHNRALAEVKKLPCV